MYGHMYRIHVLACQLVKSKAAFRFGRKKGSSKSSSVVPCIFTKKAASKNSTLILGKYILETICLLLFDKKILLLVSCIMLRRDYLENEMNEMK